MDWFKVTFILKGTKSDLLESLFSQVLYIGMNHSERKQQDMTLGFYKYRTQHCMIHSHGHLTISLKIGFVFSSKSMYKI